MTPRTFICLTLTMLIATLAVSITIDGYRADMRALTESRDYWRAEANRLETAIKRRNVP